MGRGVQRFTDLRAWQVCDVYKKAVYQVCREPSFSRDWKLRSQLQESVAAAPAHIAEGFGRFSPPDFARYAVMARASLIESQNHLRDAVDRNHITEDCRRDLDELAEAALKEVTGLMEYLQSPEALRNARRARERRIAIRAQRLARQVLRPRAEREHGAQHAELRNPNAELANAEPANAEPANAEPPNGEPPNAEQRTSNFEVRTEPEHEPRTENPEE
jgi:four helix bundle protein